MKAIKYAKLKGLCAINSMIIHLNYELLTGALLEEMISHWIGLPCCDAL